MTTATEGLRALAVEPFLQAELVLWAGWGASPQCLLLQGHSPSGALGL